MEFVFLFIGLALGALVGFLLGKRGASTVLDDDGELEQLKLGLVTMKKLDCGNISSNACNENSF